MASEFQLGTKLLKAATSFMILSRKRQVLRQFQEQILVIFGRFFRKFFACHFSRKIFRTAVFRFREKCEKLCSTKWDLTSFNKSQ